MADTDLDRSEPATPYKLQKAREKGQVPKSADIVASTVFIAAIVFLYWQGAGAVRRLFVFERSLLAQVGRVKIDEMAVWELLRQCWESILVLIGPFFLTLVVAAIVGNVLQTGPMLAFEPLKMNWERLNPADGLKRMLSLRKLFDTLRACIKLGILVLIVYYALKGLTPQFFHIASATPLTLLDIIIQDMASIGLKIGLALALIAVVDLIYNRREFAKNMRMSRRDIKDEVKHRDGDPRIRSRLRQLRQEMLKKSLSMKNTRKADVLIVNPTHFAVALSYEHGQMDSPRLVAKGAGAFALAMRRIASSHRIPIVQNVTLARALFREMEIEQYVPPHRYADVARIIVWVFAMRDAKDRARQATAGTI